MAVTGGFPLFSTASKVEGYSRATVTSFYFIRALSGILPNQLTNRNFALVFVFSVNKIYINFNFKSVLIFPSSQSNNLYCQ